MPRAANGLRVSAVTRGLQHPRWLCVLPTGDIPVAESEAPAKPDDRKGVRGKVQKIAQTRSGSGAADDVGNTVWRLLDFAVLANYARRCSREGSGHGGDDVRDSSWSDPIFRPLDIDTQQSESFVFRALRIVGTLLDMP